MITKVDAEIKIFKLISAYPPPDNDRYIIVVEETIEKEWGWVFFYTSEKYLQTGELQYAVAGNAPFIVAKENGAIFTTGTAEPIENYISRFEITGSPQG